MEKQGHVERERKERRERGDARVDVSLFRACRFCLWLEEVRSKACCHAQRCFCSVADSVNVSPCVDRFDLVVELNEVVEVQQAP